MSGDNIGRSSVPPDGNSGSVNARDVYGYSGPEGAANANSGTAGGPRNPYVYSGDGGRGNGQTGDHTGGQGSSSDCNWRPDYSYSSPHARAWLQASRQQATHPIDRDSNGLYTVQFGDSLSGIAAREIRAEGHQGKIDQGQIKEEVGRIVQANDQKYASLDCNKDLIKTGWQLEVPRWQPRLPAQSDQHRGPQSGARDDGGDQRPRLVQTPADRQPPNYYDQPHQPHVTINKYYIDNATFYQGGSGSSSTNSYDRGQRPNPGNYDDRYSYDGYRGQQQPHAGFQLRIGNVRIGNPEYRSLPIAPSNGYDNNGGYSYSQDSRQAWIATQNAARNHGQGSFYAPRASYLGRQPQQDWNNYNGNNSGSYNDGYTVQGGYTSNDGYSVQTVPYNPANGRHVRTLPYNPASGYRIQPISYSTTNSGYRSNYTDNNSDNTYTY